MHADPKQDVRLYCVPGHKNDIFGVHTASIISKTHLKSKTSLQINFDKNGSELVFQFRFHKIYPSWVSECQKS